MPSARPHCGVSNLELVLTVEPILPDDDGSGAADTDAREPRGKAGELGKEIRGRYRRSIRRPDGTRLCKAEAQPDVVNPRRSFVRHAKYGDGVPVSRKRHLRKAALIFRRRVR